MLYLQQGPAETTGYMIFGFAVIFGTVIIYLVSLFTRWRNLQQDKDLMEEFEPDDQKQNSF